MDNLSRDVEGYIKDMIDHSLGIPISTHALEKKLHAAQESQRRLREQCTSLVSRLKEKDQVIELARSEASINAQAVKKFVEENGKLSGECEDLAKQCKNWERECFLYHQDREALMDFGNEADERAREAESKVRELEEEVKTMSDVMKKRRVESDEKLEEEECLVDSVLASFVSEDETKFGRVFLETASVQEKTLLRRWDELKPSTRKAVTLVSMVKRVEKEKECLILNLAKAEQEVELVCEQNRELDEENRKLLKQCGGNSPLQCSAERSKSKKRKSPKMMSSSSPGSISDV